MQGSAQDRKLCRLPPPTTSTVTTRTVTTTTPRPEFKFGLEGTNTCPVGYGCISTEDECRQAAAELAPGQYTHRLNEGHQPKGCFYDGGTNGGRNVFLNDHATGGIEQNDHGLFDKKICRVNQTASSSAPTVTPKGTNTTVCMPTTTATTPPTTHNTSANTTTATSKRMHGTASAQPTAPSATTAAPDRARTSTAPTRHGSGRQNSTNETHRAAASGTVASGQPTTTSRTGSSSNDDDDVSSTSGATTVITVIAILLVVVCALVACIAWRKHHKLSGNERRGSIHAFQAKHQQRTEGVDLVTNALYQVSDTLCAYVHASTCAHMNLVVPLVLGVKINHK